jgi:hypothetical protein
MLSHMNRHEEEGDTPPHPHSLKKCSEYDAVGALQPDQCAHEHRGMASPEQRKTAPFQCTECGADFRFQSSFLSHRKLHLKERGLSDQEAKSR